MLKNTRRETVKILLGGLAGLLGGVSLPLKGFKQTNLPKQMEWESVPYDFARISPFGEPGEFLEPFPWDSFPSAKYVCVRGNSCCGCTSCL